ncbi:MAG: enoyl-CoA hydratase/isomerase family protein, partial [Burkholderiales bacterium]
MATPTGQLVLAERHGAALVLRLNRPEAGNAISREVALALADQVRACASDPALRALIITGSGPRYFCTGGDVKAYARLSSAEELDQVFNLMRDVCDAIEALPFPAIAAINGFSVGGGSELALACDLRIADASVQIGFPQSRLGIIPGWDGVPRLLKTVGRGSAAMLLYTGKRVSASEARDIGLVDEVVPDGKALERALELAATFAEVAPLSLHAIKTALSEAESAQAGTEARRNARASFARLWFTEDHKEAERA